MKLQAVPSIKLPTSQQWIYLAAGARLLVLQAEQDAAKRVNPTQRKIPLEAAQVYRELVALCEENERLMSGSGGGGA